MAIYIFEDSLFSESWMNLFFILLSLMTYLNYIFLVDVSIFTITGDNKEKKNQFFKYFWRILIKFEKKVLKIHKHSWQLTLINSNTQKFELRTNSCWKHSISETLTPVPSAQKKFIFEKFKHSLSWTIFVFLLAIIYNFPTFISLIGQLEYNRIW